MLIEIPKKLKRQIILFILGAIKYLPFYSIMKLRNICYRAILKKMGKGSNISDAVTIANPSNVSIGERSSIHEYSYFAGKGEVIIGDYVAIANNCTIISETHNFTDRSIPVKLQGLSPQPVIIGDDVWIGSHVTILGNVRIGKGAIIGAGSVVTRDIPEYAVAVGVPCNVIKYR
ncbi:MAG: acetyltransferase [Odoribacter sp.]|nr:acetyltransferase [Odoribacter sp.]